MADVVVALKEHPANTPASVRTPKAQAALASGSWVPPAEIARLAQIPGFHRVGPRTYLDVRRPPRAEWAYRYTPPGGKTHELGLGGYPGVPYAEIREDVERREKQRRAGVDPLAAKRAAQAAARAAVLGEVTFKQAAQAYLTSNRASWSNPKHAAQWEATLEAYADPVFGDEAVSKVGRAHVLLALEPIWNAKPETASRLRGRIEAVLDYATVHGWRTGDSNPARWRGNLQLALPARAKVAKVVHHPALDWRLVPGFMARLREWDSISARALEFTILSAARSGEVRGCAWSEIDLAAALWTIPAARMKADREHSVPLPLRAVDILHGLAPLRRWPAGLVFPGGKPGKPLTDVSLSKALSRLVPGVTVHGMRSAFRDWCAEATDTPREVAEAALAHVVGDKTESAYRRETFLAKRRVLMTAWAKYCAGEAAADPPEADAS